MTDKGVAPDPPGGGPGQEREQSNHPQNTPDAGKRSSGSLSGTAVIAVGAAIILLVLLLAMGIIPRMKQSHEVAARATAEAHKPPKVIVTKPLPSPAAILTLPSTTLAIEDAQVGARTTGYVSRRYVDIGAHVRAGQVLAEIQSPDVDAQLYQANAQVAQSQATVRQSEASVANQRAIVAQYRANVRQAQANLQTARAQLADSKAKLAQLQSAEQSAEAQREQVRQNVDIQQANLRQANTQLNLAKVTLDRYETLLKSGYVALQDVDQNRATYQNAQAAVSSAQASVNSAIKAVDAADANVQSAQANIRSGEAEVSAAQKNVDAVSETIQAAQSTVTAALATVRGGQSTVEANRYAQIANQANSKHFAALTSFEKVVAPFDGVITARNIDVGALVNAGGGGTSGGSSAGSTSATSSTNLGSASSSSATPSTTSSGGLFGLARTDVLRILVPVPQTYSPQMHVGLVADVTFTEYPGRKFMGTVTDIAGALDSASRTLLTELHLSNPRGELLPGMFAQVRFDLAKTPHGLRVPATAVIFDALGTRVVVVGPKNRLHYQNVHEGRDFNAQLEITDGIGPNDTLVVTPSDDLFEGEEINPVFAPPAPPEPGAPGAGTQPAAHGTRSNQTQAQ